MLTALSVSEVSSLEEPLSRALMGLSALVGILDDSQGQGHIKNHELSMLLDTAVLRPLIEVEQAIFRR